MEIVEKCKSAWSAANTDTERFAALFVVVKLVKTSELTERQRKEIFETLGFTFLSRLFQSEAPFGCSPKIFKSVALAVLSCFSTDSDIVVKDQMCSFIVTLNDILKSCPVSQEDESLVSDTLSCLLDMTHHEKCRKRMLDKGLFVTLINFYCDNTYDQNKALQVLKMLFFSEIDMTEDNQNALTNLLKALVRQFSNEQSEKKFELCELILSIFLKFQTFHLQSDTASEIRETLTDILQNKLGKEQRDAAIKLASLMIDKFGSNWFTDGTENSERFFVVLVQIVCIEIRMLLEDRTLTDVVNEARLLSACYGILECIISTMVGENWFQSNQRYACKLLISVKSAIKAVLGFLKEISTKWNCVVSNECSSLSPAEEVTFATIRLLCSWLAEETFALQDEVCDMLPFILSLCKEWFLKTLPEETKQNIDLLRFLISPLCHLTADDKSRTVLLHNGLLWLLFRYMEYQWHLFQKEQSSETEILLTTLSGILLNVVVLESHLVSEDEDFFTFLKFLFNALPQLSSDQEHLTLKANFSVLGILITKQCHKRVKSCETSFYRFLSSSIKFLWDAHHVEEENGRISFAITRKYREVWSDVMELWFLGMQALSTLLPLMPWIASFLVESGWPTVIIISLSRVHSRDIEGNIKSAYQAFLSTLVRVCDPVAFTLIESDAVSVCKKHELLELERLLLKFVVGD